MPFVVIDIDGCNNIISGKLLRRLLQIRPGTFVGALSIRATEQLWESIVASSPKSALLVLPARNDLGIAMKHYGEHRYTPGDFDGIQLVKFHGKISAI